MAVCRRAKKIVPAMFFLPWHGGYARGAGVYAADGDLRLCNVWQSRNLSDGTRARHGHVGRQDTDAMR